MVGPRLWHAASGASGRDVVLLLHGFTVTHHTWDPVSPLLAEDHRLILPDLPGHGRSSLWKDTSVEASSDALADLIRATTPEKVSVVGYSLGGRIALDLTCRHPELVAALVLEGASPGIEDPAERTKRREEDDSLADEIERRGVEWFVDYWEAKPLFATQRALPPAAVDAIRKDRLSNSARGLAASLRGAGTGAMAPLWRRMEAIGVPVLLVVGEEDRKFVETATAMKKRIPGSSMVEVRGAGHSVHVEKPAEFAAVVERFLEGGSARPRVKTKRGSR